MRFLLRTWAGSSGLHWIQQLPIIQWFYLWVEQIPLIRKKWGEEKELKNLSSCSLNVVVCKGVWRECCSWLAGERRWEPPWDCLAASASGLGTSNDASTPFLWHSPISATHRDLLSHIHPNTTCPPEYNLST